MIVNWNSTTIPLDSTETEGGAITSPLSSNQEKALSLIQAYGRECLSKKNVKSRFSRLHSANILALAKPFKQLNHLQLKDQDRIPVIIALFHFHYKQRANRQPADQNFDVIGYLPPSADLYSTSRVWALESPEGFSVYLRETYPSTSGEYKTINLFKKILFHGSPLRPYETFDFSTAVQIRPRLKEETKPEVKIENQRRIAFVADSIKNHSILANKVRELKISESSKEILSNTFIPNPPQLFSEQTQVYFQEYYEDFRLSLEKNKLSPSEILTILFHAGNTLLFLHLVGLTHNDVKAGNILYDRKYYSQVPVIGMLNDFDMLSSNWGIDFSNSFIQSLQKSFDIDYLCLSAALNIKSPLSDFYNFAQMVYRILSKLNARECKAIHNSILKQIIMDKIPVNRQKEKDTNSVNDSLDNLRSFFANAFEALCDLNIRFVLDLLGEDLTKELKAKMRKYEHTPQWDQIFISTLGKILKKLPQKEFTHEAIKKTFEKINTPYNLKNMIGELKKILNLVNTESYHIQVLAKEEALNPHLINYKIDHKLLKELIQKVKSIKELTDSTNYEWKCYQLFLNSFLSQAIKEGQNSEDSICSILKLHSPLNDWYNFAKETLKELYPIPLFDLTLRKERNKVLKRAIQKCGSPEFKPPRLEENPTDSPLVKLQLFFINAFSTLVYENACFLLYLLEENDRKKLQDTYLNACLSHPNFDADPFEILREFLQKIPLDKQCSLLTEKKRKQLFEQIKMSSDYNLENMEKRLHSELRNKSLKPKSAAAEAADLN